MQAANIKVEGRQALLHHVWKKIVGGLVAMVDSLLKPLQAWGAKPPCSGLMWPLHKLPDQHKKPRASP